MAEHFGALGLAFQYEVPVMSEIQDQEALFAKYHGVWCIRAGRVMHGICNPKFCGGRHIPLQMRTDPEYVQRLERERFAAWLDEKARSVHADAEAMEFSAKAEVFQEALATWNAYLALAEDFRAEMGLD